MLSDLSRTNFPPNPINKQGYHLEFSDEFDQAKIDTDKWIPCYLPQWSSCERSKPNYKFEDNKLILQILKDQQPWCPEFDEGVICSAIQSGVFSGSAGSKFGQSRFSDKLVVRQEQINVQKYTPQFGYFEIRVKGLSTNANHVSLWMIGYEDIPENSAEICLFELLGSENGKEESVVRYGIHPWSDPTMHEEFFVDKFMLDSAHFHIYAVEWTPQHVDFYIDNIKIKRIHQSPQYPMQFMLGMFELPFEGAWNGVYNPDDAYPKTFTIDYVRGYQPIEGYNP